jgi:competence protein ComEC
MLRQTPSMLLFVLLICVSGCSDEGTVVPLGQNTGTVTITPQPGTIDAPWRISGPDGFDDSGQGARTFAGRPAGSYSVAWGEVAGWVAPGDQTRTLVQGGSVSFVGTYISGGAEDRLMITVFDVGQGDATLIRSPGGMTLLFDAGPSGSHGIILSYLDNAGIDSLDYIVTSHYHADHVGAAAAVYNAKGARHGVWDRGWSYTTSTYDTYAATVSADRQTLTQGQILDVGQGVTATVLALNGNGVLDPPFHDSSRENEYSVALLIEYGDFSFFQAGDLPGITNSANRDIETSVAQTMVAMGRADVDVYRASHHGSYTSSNAFFLNTTTPGVAIIACGADNPYGHPHQEPVVRMQERNIHIYMTTEGAGHSLPPEDMTIVGGHIVIETTGYETYTVNGDIWDVHADTGR